MGRRRGRAREGSGEAESGGWGEDLAIGEG